MSPFRRLKYVVGSYISGNFATSDLERDPYCSQSKLRLLPCDIIYRIIFLVETRCVLCQEMNLHVQCIYLNVRLRDSRAMAQELSRRPLSTEACLRYQASPREIFDGQIWHCDKFFSEYFGFSPVSIALTFPTRLHAALSRMI